MADSGVSDRSVVEPHLTATADADETTIFERRPGDIAWLVVAVGGFVLCALWSQASGDTNENLCKAINGIGDGLEGLAQAWSYLGSIWFVGIVVIVLLVGRWPRAVRMSESPPAGHTCLRSASTSSQTPSRSAASTCGSATGRYSRRSRWPRRRPS